jgi:hypothetical protein
VAKAPPNCVREVLLVPLRILHAAPPVAVLRVGGLGNGYCAGTERAVEDGVSVRDAHIQALRRLAEGLRVPKRGARAAHHHDAGAEFHRGVVRPAVRAPHPRATCLEAERLRQKRHRPVNVSIVLPIGSEQRCADAGQRRAEAEGCPARLQDAAPGPKRGRVLLALSTLTGALAWRILAQGVDLVRDGLPPADRKLADQLAARVLAHGAPAGE